ncbi:MAG: hypothetical protein V4694_02425 [Pseudomonadota bacterium]
MNRNCMSDFLQIVQDSSKEKVIETQISQDPLDKDTSLVMKFYDNGSFNVFSGDDSKSKVAVTSPEASKSKGSPPKRNASSVKNLDLLASSPTANAPGNQPQKNTSEITATPSSSSIQSTSTRNLSSSEHPVIVPVLWLLNLINGSPKKENGGNNGR